MIGLNGAAIGENIDPLDSKYPEIEEIQKRGWLRIIQRLEVNLLQSSLFFAPYDSRYPKVAEFSTVVNSK